MAEKIGRNNPCPCGSGKKYKHCCGQTDESVPNQPAVAVEGKSTPRAGTTIPGFYVVQAQVDEQQLSPQLLAHEKLLTMPGSRFTKFISRFPAEGWGSIFLSPGQALVMADDAYLGQRLQQLVDSTQSEPLEWGQVAPAMDFIAIAEEMMVDKFVEKWLLSPDPALNNLTPWQAVKVGPLRSRLTHLLEEWEKDMHSRLEGVGYVYPFTWLRERLGLGDEERTEITADEVETFRAAVMIKDDIGDYSWLGEDYAQTIYMADMLLRDGGWQNRRHRAFIFYLWNEYTTLQQPILEGEKEWPTAIKLLSAYYPEPVPPQDVEAGAAFAQIDPELLDHNLDLFYAYYQRFPLAMEDVSFLIDAQWESLDLQDQLRIYGDLMEAMMEMVRLGDQEQHYEKSLESFLQSSNTVDSDELANLYGEFFTQWYLLDARLNEQDYSVVQMFAQVVKELGPAEQTGLQHLLDSHFSIYKVAESEGPDCTVRDLMLKRTLNVTSLRRDPMCRGDFFLARLLPVEGIMVPLQAWIPISSVMGAQLVKIAERLAQENGQDQAPDQDFLKTNGIALVAAFSYLLTEQARQYNNQ
ncbi:MAG: YecA family protein [Methylocystaceae bacterium]